MKKAMVALLSLVLLLGAVLPVAADAAAQTTPCAPGEHKVCADIYNFENDKLYPFVEVEDGYQSTNSYYAEAMATLHIVADGELTLDYYFSPSNDGTWAEIAHNADTIVKTEHHSDKGVWKSITISVMTGDRVTVKYHHYGDGSDSVTFRASGLAFVAEENVDLTCTQGVVCEVCGTVVKTHAYDNACDEECNVCGFVRMTEGHKVYRDIFTFINDERFPFREINGLYYPYTHPIHPDINSNFVATATWLINMDGTITIKFFSSSSAYGGVMQIKHNGLLLAEEKSGTWKWLTISVKAGDTLQIARSAFSYGSCQFSVNGSVLVAADEFEPTCSKSVVCDLCGTVVKEALPHTYDDVLDADCNVCGETREVTYTGWLSQYGTWYYYQNGVMLKKTWARDSVGWCYLGWDGSLAKNWWAKDSVGWCYVGEDGYLVTNEWVKDSVGWCYLGSDGYCLTNTWVKDSVGWCYLGANGRMLTNGWVKDSVGWCYVGADGYCVTNRWVQDSNGWCYVGSDGYCVTETWVRDSVGWCYLNANGNVTKGAWVKTNDKWYFVDSYGYMVTGKQYVGGKTYYFDIVTGELME